MVGDLRPPGRIADRLLSEGLLTQKMLSDLKKEWQLQMEQGKPRQRQRQQEEEDDPFVDDVESVIESTKASRIAKATARTATKTKLIRKKKNPNL